MTKAGGSNPGSSKRKHATFVDTSSMLRCLVIISTSLTIWQGRRVVDEPGAIVKAGSSERLPFPHLNRVSYLLRLSVVVLFLLLASVLPGQLFLRRTYSTAEASALLPLVLVVYCTCNCTTPRRIVLDAADASAHMNPFT